ncbi:tetratricopeptide repeat protein [Bacteroides sp.]
MDKRLSVAEALMEERPDSALKLLRTSFSVQELDNKEQMRYYLLLIQAMDKCGEPIVEMDSLLDLITAYYVNSNKSNNKALCYFYKGRICYDIGHYEAAAIAFKQAEDYALRVGDKRLVSLICNNLGYTDYQADLYPGAIVQFRKVFDYARGCRDTLRMISNLQNIGQCFALSQQSDSVLGCLEEIRLLLPGVKEDERYLDIWHNIAALYFGCGYPDKAFAYLEEAIGKTQNSENLYRSYVVMGELYNEQGDKDRALQCWEAAWPVKDPEVKAYLYKCLSDFAYKEGDYELAAEHAISYITYADSLYQNTQAKEVAEIQELYDNEVLKVANLQYRISVLSLSLFCGVILFISWLLYVKHKKEKTAIEIRFQNIIFQKEQEIDSYKLSLELAECLNRERSKEIERLKRLVEMREMELDDLKASYKRKQAGYQKMLVSVSIVNGMELCRDALAGKKRTALQVQDCKDAILYYRTVDAAFLASLEKTWIVLTPLDELVCILFRMRLTHQQVADFLGNTSVTLSQRKLRLKSRCIHANSHRLEDLICSL